MIKMVDELKFTLTYTILEVYSVVLCVKYVCVHGKGTVLLLQFWVPLKQSICSSFGKFFKEECKRNS